MWVEVVWLGIRGNTRQNWDSEVVGLFGFAGGVIRFSGIRGRGTEAQQNRWFLTPTDSGSPCGDSVKEAEKQ